MTALVLVSGRLVRDPEKKVSGKGREYATATLRDGSGPDAVFWRIMAFSEDICGELLGLRAGDGLSASGNLKAEIYAPDSGEPRISMSLIADRLLTLQRPKRQASQPRNSRRYDPSKSVHAPPGFNSEVPF